MGHVFRLSSQKELHTTLCDVSHGEADISEIEKWAAREMFCFVSSSCTSQNDYSSLASPSLGVSLIARCGSSLNVLM